MPEYLELGSAPPEESCVQVESTGRYVSAMQAECTAWKNQLLRKFGACPNTKLAVKWSQHDYGKYAEVHVRFNTEDPIGMEYALKLERESPGSWDSQALMELGRESVTDSLHPEGL